MSGLDCQSLVPICIHVYMYVDIGHRLQEHVLQLSGVHEDVRHPNIPVLNQCTLIDRQIAFFTLQLSYLLRVHSYKYMPGISNRKHMLLDNLGTPT